MAQKELKENIKLLLLAILALLALGTVIFSSLEGWSIVDSFYFVTVTATTVGYGDLTPTTAGAKLMTVLYSLAIIPLLLYAFSLVAKYEMERVYRKVHGIARKQREQEEDLEKTERKLKRQSAKMKAQESELEKTERKLKEQARINKQQELELGAVEDIVVETLPAIKKAKKKRK